MSNSYFIVSEWLPKASCHDELLAIFKQLATITFKEDFDKHCQSEYVTRFAEKYLLNEETKLIEDWRCRLLAVE